ncbi:MAG: hypothetical protein NTU53_00755, partial [Planctomycetota bacterium]|nr:hypothetical protein [Planctomycetota bacterium]
MKTAARKTENVLGKDLRVNDVVKVVSTRHLGRHVCGGPLVKDGRKVRCEQCSYQKPLRRDGRPPRIANGTPVHIKSDHFAEEFDGVVTIGEYDGGWLYRVRPTSGTPPAAA